MALTPDGDLVIVNEAELRRLCTDYPPALKMLDLWRELVRQNTGGDVEVGMADRHDYPALNGLGMKELNTARPMVHENRVILVVFVEDPSNVREVVFTHEVGHWVLHFKGFKGLKDRSTPHSGEEIFLASLCHHIPLYALQRSLGEDPQAEIDSRANHHFEVLCRERETNDQFVSIEKTFLIADDVLNASEQVANSILKTLEERFPRTLGLVNQIRDIRDHYDCLNPEQNFRFFQRIIKTLKMPGGLGTSR